MLGYGRQTHTAGRYLRSRMPSAAGTKKPAGMARWLFAALLAFVSFQAAAGEVTWVGCGISKLGYMQDLSAAFEKKNKGITVSLQGGGATRGIRNVSSGSSLLGGSCRLPLLNASGDAVIAKESNIKLLPLGWDSLVVITHPSNEAVTNITLEQLKAVLTGKITRWSELGGPDRPINLYVRKGKTSGVGITLRQQLFDNTDQDFAARAIVKRSSGVIEKAVESDPDALAVSGISSSRHRSVRMLSLEGVKPTMDALQRGKYPLFRILFLVAPPNYKDDPVLNAFVDFAYSLEGQKIIEKAGTLPFHRGIFLMSRVSFDYVRSIDAVEKAGIYTTGGH
jgi:phosphate transport system substrate-binding protein